MNFDTAFERLIDPQHEGGYSTVRSDPGNWTGGKAGSGELKGTKYGVSAKSYPKVDIRNLTIAGAKAIYAADFWKTAGCDVVPDRLKFLLFSTGVLRGPARAVIALQRAVFAARDGNLGPKTQLAINAMPIECVIGRFVAEVMIDLTELPGWSDAGRGWSRRFMVDLLDALAPTA